MAWLHRHPAWADALAGVLLAAALVAVGLGLRRDGFDAIGLRVLRGRGLAFVVRRRLPVVTLAVVVVAIVAYGASGQPGGPIYATTFLAAVNLAVLRPMRTWLPWTVAATAALVAASWAADGFSAHLIPVALLLLVFPKLAGDGVRARRLRMETLEARVSAGRAGDPAARGRGAPAHRARGP